MSITSALTCARKFIALATAAGMNLSNLKLQKLVYAQAWHLAIYDVPLFPDPIEAWVHDPVVRSLYAHYRSCGGNIDAIECDPIADSHVIAVFKEFGSFDGSQLERMTHSESPWVDARVGLAPDEASRNVIPHEAMRKFYASL
jgi:uncharacterized phage-associated protein